MTAPARRPVIASDATALASLHAAAFPPAERWGETAIRLMLALDGAFGLAITGPPRDEIAAEEPAPALAAGSPCGFILARAVAGEAEVLTIAVHPCTQRIGIGATLLTSAVEEAGRRGAASVFLEVSEGNVAARALYARAGAVPVGRRRRYYPDGSDALVLRITPPCG